MTPKTSASDLTKNEKLVLYGLVRWPSLNDRELSKKIGIKRSTVTAIRNKLKREEYFKTTTIPDLKKIGYELITVLHSNYNPLTPFLMREKYADIVKEIFHYFFLFANDRERVIFSAARNFTETRKEIFDEENIYTEMKFLTEEGNTYAFFPFRQHLSDKQPNPSIHISLLDVDLMGEVLIC